MRIGAEQGFRQSVTQHSPIAMHSAGPVLWQSPCRGGFKFAHIADDFCLELDSARRLCGRQAHRRSFAALVLGRPYNTVSVNNRLEPAAAHADKNCASSLASDPRALNAPPHQLIV